MSLTSGHVIVYPEISVVILFFYEILGDNETDKNDCNICFCDDCQDDDWCFYPLREFLDRHEYIKLLKKNDKKESPQDKDEVSSDIHCLTTSWEEEKDNEWVKVIHRFTYNEEIMNDCINRKKNPEHFINIICKDCYYSYCNWKAITAPSYCYTCETNTSELLDMNCIAPQIPETPTIATENVLFIQNCTVVSWVEDDYIFVKRGAEENLSYCEDKQSNRNYKNVVCKQCTGNLCNDDTIDVDIPKKLNCYECQCKDCNQTKDRNCLLPETGKTNFSSLSSNEDSCYILTAINEKNQTMFLERRKACQLSYCNLKFLELSKKGYNKFQCSACRRDLCNDNKRFNLLKILKCNGTTEEDD